MHAITISKPSLAWTLCSKASELSQILGYHQLPPSTRSTSNEDIDPTQFLFWAIFIIDKILSLRLGRPATIQNWDITTPMISLHSTRSPLGATISVWIDTARCQGDVYQSLYSPEALAQPDHVRQSRVETLASQLRDISLKSREIDVRTHAC